MSEIMVVGAFVMDNVAIVDKFCAEGETVIAKEFACFPGGKGVNQCIAAVRLGGDVQMCGMLGRDKNGKAFREILNREGVNAENVFYCDKPTGTAQIQVNNLGQNRICVIPSANREFGFSEVDRIDKDLKNSKLLMLQLEMRTDVMAELIKRAYAYGVKILLNPAPAIKLGDDILEKVDYLIPNEKELSVLTDMPIETEGEIIAATKKLIDSGVKTVIATLGSKGALIVDKNELEFINGYKVKAVDTVAAGDSFCGAFAVGIMKGKSMREAVKFANAMGALTVQEKGAIPSLHTLDQVERFMKKYEYS